MPQAQRGRCRWKKCGVELADYRASFCDVHREDGQSQLKSERNARDNANRRRLAAHAPAPDPTHDGGVVLPAPLARSLAQQARRLDETVQEYQRSVNVFLGWELNGHFEGWAELKAEHEDAVRVAVTDLCVTARDTAAVFAEVLPAPDR